jgi:hypothetical protein
MAEHNLNLKVTRPDDNTIRVSWDDLFLRVFSKKESGIWGFSVGVPPFFFLLVMSTLVSPYFMLISIIWALAGIYLFNRPRMEPRSITFTPETVHHEGRSYPTERITRFEYGSRQALTGVSPRKDLQGQPAEDPYLIRMWIDDAKAVELSVNNWQTQVNHQIRDALDRALTTVRQEQAKAEQAETYGQQDDKGLPDY